MHQCIKYWVFWFNSPTWTKNKVPSITTALAGAPLWSAKLRRLSTSCAINVLRYIQLYFCFSWVFLLVDWFVKFLSVAYSDEGRYVVKDFTNLKTMWHFFKVPFIAFYRKEYVERELNIKDLWKVWQWDEKVGTRVFSLLFFFYLYIIFYL